MTITYSHHHQFQGNAHRTTEGVWFEKPIVQQGDGLVTYNVDGVLPLQGQLTPIHRGSQLTEALARSHKGSQRDRWMPRASKISMSPTSMMGQNKRDPRCGVGFSSSDEDASSVSKIGYRFLGTRMLNCRCAACVRDLCQYGTTRIEHLRTVKSQSLPPLHGNRIFTGFSIVFWMWRRRNFFCIGADAVKI